MDSVLEAALTVHLKLLKMPGALRVLREVGRQARDGGWSYEEYLRELLDSEVRNRADNVVVRRLREARFPVEKSLDHFDFTLQPDLQRDRMLRLARCEWVDEHRSVLIAGPVGTGKTHLAIALGTAAARRRYRVRFYRADDLVRELTEAKSDQVVGRLLKRLDRVDVLVLDELGFVPFDRTGAELLFTLVSRRSQRRSTIVTTNLAFAEWVRVFGDEKLTAALLDRLGERAEVVLTTGTSYRMRTHDEKEKAEP
jgi:DNA replication protein DnaC